MAKQKSRHLMSKHNPFSGDEKYTNDCCLFLPEPTRALSYKRVWSELYHFTIRFPQHMDAKARPPPNLDHANRNRTIVQTFRLVASVEGANNLWAQGNDRVKKNSHHKGGDRMMGGEVFFINRTNQSGAAAFAHLSMDTHPTFVHPSQQLVFRTQQWRNLIGHVVSSGWKSINWTDARTHAGFVFSINFKTLNLWPKFSAHRQTLLLFPTWTCEFARIELKRKYTPWKAKFPSSFCVKFKTRKHILQGQRELTLKRSAVKRGDFCASAHLCQQPRTDG